MQLTVCKTSQFNYTRATILGRILNTTFVQTEPPILVAKVSRNHMENKFYESTTHHLNTEPPNQLQQFLDTIWIFCFCYKNTHHLSTKLPIFVPIVSRNKTNKKKQKNWGFSLLKCWTADFICTYIYRNLAEKKHLKVGICLRTYNAPRNT